MENKVLSNKLRIVVGITDATRRARLVHDFLSEYVEVKRDKKKGNYREKILVYKNEENFFIHGFYHVGKERSWIRNIVGSLVHEYDILSEKKWNFRDDFVRLDKFIGRDDKTWDEFVLSCFE